MAAPIALLAFLSPWELAGLAAILVLLFGVKKLPELGKGLGQGIRNFKGEMKQMQDDSSASDPGAEKKD